MKKNLLLMVILLTGVLVTACGQADTEQGIDMLPGTIESNHLPTAASGMSGSGNASSVVSGGDAAGGKTQSTDKDQSVDKDQTMEDLKAAGMLDTEGEWVEEDVLLSDQILRAGDTMQIMYSDNGGTLYHGLDVTLHEAELYDSPEAAGLNRAQMQKETENYDVTGDPEWCGIDEGRVLVCDLTVKNVGGDEDGELHISEIMAAYADPDTRKVTIISCAPAYFSASLSTVGASDYYHYQIPQGESKDMKVAWLIQSEYEAENLYLGVDYDMREPDERQYFRLVEQK